MPRDPRAYLEDIVEACQAISAATQGLDLPAYLANRLVRSAVEREFIIIGEALVALSRRSPAEFAGIGHARRIIDFRNQLTHEYPTIDDTIVWAIADRDVPVLQRECQMLLDRGAGGSE
jgi:uncharacterized protein with HEPN domain